MSGERDQYGTLVDPAEAYEEFLVGLHDILAETDHINAAPGAIAKLRETRSMFIADFKAKFPGRGRGRAVW